MSRAVGHVLGLYLPITQTFVYEYLTHMTGVRSVVLAEELCEPARFPFEPIALVPRRRAVERVLDKAAHTLTGRRPVLERRYAHAIEENDIAVVHGHFGWSALTTLAIKEATGVPVVTTFYGADVSRLPSMKGIMPLYERLFEVGDLFLAEGNHLRSSLIALGCPAGRIRIQHIAVDVAGIPFQPRKLESGEIPVVLMCGSFVEKKGFAYGIRAFAQARQELGAMKLVIVGDGGLRSTLGQLIREMELEDDVTMTGYVDRARYMQIARDAHVFMAPSVTDELGETEGGAPTVLLEMQAAGLPVVATTHADIPEVVADGESGLLVPERDSQALAAALIDVLKHADQWPRMGACGRRHVETSYDIRTEARRLESVYTSLDRSVARVDSTHAHLQDVDVPLVETHASRSECQPRVATRVSSGGQ